jgi:hypothetical protein
MTFCVLAAPGLDLPQQADKPDLGTQQDNFASWMLPELNPRFSVVCSVTECALGNCAISTSYIDERLIWISRRARTPPSSITRPLWRPKLNANS